MSNLFGLYRATVLDSAGNPAIATEITVETASPPVLETLYPSPTGGLTLPNPIMTDASGVVSFYTNPGQCTLSGTYNNVAFSQSVSVPQHPLENLFYFEEFDFAAGGQINVGASATYEMGTMVLSNPGDFKFRYAVLGAAWTGNQSVRCHLEVDGHNLNVEVPLFLSTGSGTDATQANLVGFGAMALGAGSHVLTLVAQAGNGASAVSFASAQVETSFI